MPNDAIQSNPHQGICPFCEQWQRLHMELHASEKSKADAVRECDQKALDKASIDVDHRLHAMNELRSQISEERGRYLLRESYDEQHNALRDSVDVRLKLLENMKSNVEGRVWMMGAFIMVLTIFIHFVAYYYPKR